MKVCPRLLNGEVVFFTDTPTLCGTITDMKGEVYSVDAYYQSKPVKGGRLQYKGMDDSIEIVCQFQLSDINDFWRYDELLCRV